MPHLFSRLRCLSFALIACCTALAAPAAPAAAQGSIFLRPAALDAAIADAQWDRQGLRVDFAEAMRVWDNAATPTVRITPAVALQNCRWDSDTTLACAFVDEDTGAPPATRFEVELPADLQTQSGRRLGAQRFALESQRPTLRADVGAWTDGVPEITLYANQALDTARIGEALRLRVNGRALPLRVTKNDSYNKFVHLYRLTLPAATELPEDSALELSLSPGLRGASGPLPGTQQTDLLRLRLREAMRLRAAHCAGRHELVTAEAGVLGPCVPQEPVRLLFTQAFDEAGKRALTAQLPPGLEAVSWGGRYGYGTERIGDWEHAPALEVTLRAQSPETQYALRLDALRGVFGATPAQVELQLRTDAERPSLHAPHAALLLADGSWPADAAHSRNAPALAFAVRALGADARRGTFRTRDSRGKRVPLTPDATTTGATLAEGGAVEWAPMAPARQKTEPNAAAAASAPEQLPWSRALQVAAPQFELTALASSTEVAVWATRWEDGASLAGAEVELLLADTPEDTPRVVARGRTGADGLVRLALPEDLPLPAEDDDSDSPTRWWLRAAAAGRRAVLPLLDARYPALPLGKDHRAAPALWGVSDRVLYRAGDTLHYRFWLRSVRGDTLRRPSASAPISLELVHTQSSDKVVVRWDARPDASGALSGSLRLPGHLADGDYCVTPAMDGGEQWPERRYALCVFVGTYRGQDLWAEARIPQQRSLRPGQALRVEVEAGYYSGGPAAGAALEGLEAELVPSSPAEAFPDYADFHFGDENADEDSLDLELPDNAPDALDGEGRARLTLPLAFEQDDVVPAFGTLRAIAQVTLSERESTTSAPATAHFAREARYVGLRLDPKWPDAQSPLRVQAVVIDADGARIGDAAVTVEVAFLANQKQPPELLLRCAAPAEPAPCAVPRTRSGIYRFTARSPGAAPAVLDHFIWNGDSAATDAKTQVTLTLLTEAPKPNAPVYARLRQPHAAAGVLLAVWGGRSLHSVRAFDSSAADAVLTVSIDGLPAGEATVQVCVRERGRAAAVREGLRMPLPLRCDRAEFLVTAPPTPPAVTARFDNARAAPGQRVRLHLHNRSAVAREVVVSVQDDALRTLAQEWLGMSDPAYRELWFGGVLGWLSEVDPWLGGFHTWNADPWRVALAWDRAAGDSAVTQSSVGRDFFVEGGNGYFSGDALDRVTVTGSRVSREQAVAAPVTVMDRSTMQESPKRALIGYDLLPPDPAAQRQAFAAHLRSRFADVAAWHPDLRLAPGEERTLEIALPENLARWRAVVWNSDADGDFGMHTEATVEAGQPVETRLQTPVRLYPGDRARLAANVRHTAAAAARAELWLHVRGAAAAGAAPQELAAAQRSLRLPPRGQASGALEITADAVGNLAVEARASTGDGADAVGAQIAVASPSLDARKVQAAWLTPGETTLTLPALPAGAETPRLRLRLVPGIDGLLRRWSEDLRGYPHRCWEQMLSRAVAAALALERRRNGAAWPAEAATPGIAPETTADWSQAEAEAAVAEALENLRVFQVRDGGFRYFNGARTGFDYNYDGGYDEDRDQNGRYLPLTAYSLRALRLLRSLGHAVPEDALGKAERYLGTHAKAPATASQTAKAQPPQTKAQIAAATAALNRRAIALGAQATPTRDAADALWTQWPQLSLPAAIDAARALAASGHPQAQAAFDRLLAQAETRGEALRLRVPQRYLGWMRSDLSEQCALLGLLRDYPALGDAALRRRLLAGLGDLYAGGVPRADTQSAALCLIALRGSGASAAQTTAAVIATFGNAPRSLRLDGDRSAGDGITDDSASAQWDIPAATGGALRLRTERLGEAPVGYVVELGYREDARRAEASAVGFALTRRYAVLRKGAWQPLETAGLRSGDWVRVTLIVDTSAGRDFVAITDAVPGGLFPTDLSLSAIAGFDLERVADRGSPYFATRRLDAAAPKFYAESLPPGRHEVHYFLRANNAGDYLAAPAQAELMYGTATTARTAAERVRIATSTADAP